MLFTLFFEKSFSQEKQNTEGPQKIILEMELEQVVKFSVPANDDLEILNKEKQKYPPKTIDNVCLPENKINIPKTNTIIKEEDYDENDK